MAIFRHFGAFMLAFLLFAAPASAQQPADSDQGVLAGFISRLLSTPSSRVFVGGVDGALSSDATIRDVTVSDDQGVYLSIDRIRLVWRRTALLQRRIEVQQLEIGRITLSRRPAAVAGEPEPGPLLPELPLALRVDAFTLEELVLGEPVLGVAARLAASGSASLGAPSEGLRASLAIRRLDAPGTADLALSFIPQGQRLDVKLALDEPAGGLLARLVRAPGEPPIKLDLTGQGTLDDFNARLGFEGGPDLGAQGAARLVRSGPRRLLTLDLQARIAPLLPAAARPIFAGVTALTGSAALADDGGIVLDDLKLAAPLAELTLAGALTPDRQLDLRASARAVPNQGGATSAGATRLERLAFEGTAQGSLAAPRIEGNLDIGGFGTTEFNLATLRARVLATPAAASGVSYAFEANAEARGLAPADQGLAEAIGPDVDLRLSGDADEGGVLRFETARLASPNLAATYQGRLGASVIDGRLGLEITRLAALSRLAGRQLQGAARVDAVVTGDPERRDVSAVLTGRTTGLRLGDPTLNRLLGQAVGLAGGVRHTGGVTRIEELRITGAALSARLNGGLAAEALTLEAALSLPNLAALDARLAGAARAEARLTGPAADPDVALTVTAPEASALGQPIRDLALSAEARRLSSAPDVTLAGRGLIGGKPLALGGRIRALGQSTAPGWTVERLQASLGSVVVAANGTVAADGAIDGRASFNAGDLDDLSPLVLTKLSGRLNAELQASAAQGSQGFSVRASGDRVAAGDIRIATLAADLSANDIFRRPVLRGEARATGIVAGGQRFDTLALTAMDGGGGASALNLTGRASGFNLSAAARVQPGPPVLVRLETFAATRSGRTIRLASPATLSLGEGGVRTDGVQIDIAGGRISVSGLAGPLLDLAIDLRSVPLAAADILSPGLGLAGTAQGSASVTGSPGAPQGRFDLSIRGLSQPAIRAAGAPPLDIAAQGRLSGGDVDLQARITGGRTIDLTIDGSAAIAGEGRLNLRARGSLDAALANARLAGSGQRVAGRIAVDAAVSGTRADPRVSGSATLSGGSFSDVLQGVAIDGLEGRATGTGESVTIERLAGRTRDGGTINLAGRIALDAGFPADLRITARRARLIDSGVARLVADADLTVSGPLASAPMVRGRIAVISLDVRVPERLGGAGQPLRDARHIAPPPQTRARLAQAARAGAASRRGGAAFRLGLDIQIDAPGRIFVRGRGIDAELGGSLRLAGTTLAPTALGAFELRRGRLSILTQRLDFSRGRLTFGGGGFIPELDFVAETRAGDVTARVAVSGPADQPDFAFSSSPSLPEDEVLSRLLFQRAAGGLSPLQALQLAQAVAQLSGGGGPDVFENARRALGVDDLDVGLANGGPTVGLSRAIGNRARLNIRAGTRPEDSAIGIDIDLTRRLRLQSEIGADGRTSVGVGIEQEY